MIRSISQDTRSGRSAASFAHRPMFASPPLSPERAWAIESEWGASGLDKLDQRIASGLDRLDQRIASGLDKLDHADGSKLDHRGWLDHRAWLDRWRSGLDKLDQRLELHHRLELDEGAVEEDLLVNGVARDVPGAIDAVRRGGRRRAGQREAGVRAQRKLDERRREPLADDVGIGVHHRDPKSARRGFLGVGVLVVGAGQRPHHRRGPTTGEGGLHLGADPLGLGLDVEADQDELGTVPEATQLVDADLQRRPGRRPTDATHPHPIGPVVGKPHAVEVGGHVRPEVDL